MTAVLKQIFCDIKKSYFLGTSRAYIRITDGNYREEGLF